ncbi:MAG: hypothetical protein AAB214_17905 [Fibrobacterota bacterium]
MVVGLASMVMDGDTLVRKQMEFLGAIERYESVPVYKFLGFLTSSANVAMQAWLLVLTMGVRSGMWLDAAPFLAAVLVADFVNGVVHLAMDHASGYDCAIGPIVANFHMHHRISVYRRRNLFLVYFRESGFKFRLPRLVGAVRCRPVQVAPLRAEDNLNYAFLNGWSDPVINWIAKLCHGGCKRTTDLHDDL